MKKQNWISFEEAKEYVRRLKLKGTKEWIDYRKSGNKPDNIPSAPNETYKYEWISWGDFIGTNSIAPQNKVFLSFNECRTYTQSLKLKGQKEWIDYRKSGNKPDNIPSAPNKTYKAEWISWGDFLGTNTIANFNKIFLSFDECLSYVHSLKLKSRKEWFEYCKSGNKPDNIPSAPNKTYKAEWISWGDFLGTKTIAPFNRVYLSFDECRVHAQSLKLKNTKEWFDYCKSENKPDNIPSHADRTYKDEWISWGDFLGTNTIASQNKIFLSFNDCRIYAHSLKLKDTKEWFDYCKSGNKPDNIPSYPDTVYKAEWISWGDFLGTNSIANFNKVFLSFNECREHVQSLKLKSKNEWDEYSKSGNKPDNIPSAPDTVYKAEWISWGDFIGTNSIANFNKIFLSFNDCRIHSHSLKLKSTKEWFEYCKSGNKPDNIPSNPNITYKAEWISFGDFLGTNTIASYNRVFLSFNECRVHAQSLKLKSQKEWFDYSKSGNKPDNIPSAPNETYKAEWISWGDFLGTNTIANRYKFIYDAQAALQFLESLTDPYTLAKLSNKQLLMIISSKKYEEYPFLKDFEGLLKYEAYTSERFEKLREIKEHLQEIVDSSQHILNASPEELETLELTELPIIPENLEELLNQDEDDLMVIQDSSQEKPIELINFDWKDPLKDLDLGESLQSYRTDEDIQYLIEQGVSMVWYNIMDNQSKLKELEEHKAGKYFEIIKETFFEQFQKANALNIPKGYGFYQPPTLMQLYTCYLLLQKQNLGNFSGTGTGKTGSSVIASRFISDKLNRPVFTVYIVINSIVEQTMDSILQFFPDSNVFELKDFNMNYKPGVNNYMIVNYDKYQFEYNSKYFENVFDKVNIDFIVLDEVHSIKQREEGRKSKRKDAIDDYVAKARNINPDLYFLVMSATPIINNLMEGKSLIELITGKPYDDLKTGNNYPDALQIHKHLSINGLRKKSSYPMNLIEYTGNGNHGTQKIEELYIDVTDLTQNLIDQKESFDRILVHKKLEAISKLIKKGEKTIIYSHYVEGMIDVAQSFFKKMGYTVLTYTGKENTEIKKQNYYEFTQGSCDILIGSDPITTGLDGLQEICNRIFILSLPWTHSMYEQLLGRLWRQGSKFTNIEVYIPICYISQDKGDWSYDNHRLDIIKHKKTLADCALDGVIPSEKLPSPESIRKKCLEALIEWIDRIKEKGIDVVERKPFEYIENESPQEYQQRKMNRFSEINKNWAVKNSQTTHKELLEEPSKFFEYHRLYSERRKLWKAEGQEIPYEKIAEDIKKLDRPDYVVYDLGCGENLLKTIIDNKVISYDHVDYSQKGDVNIGDINNLVDVPDRIADIVVLSLAMMSSNHLDCISEAYRILKYEGLLFIAENCSSRTIDKFDNITDKILSVGFEVISKEEGYFIYYELRKRNKK